MLSNGLFLHFSPPLFFPLFLLFVLVYCNGIHLISMMILRHSSKCTRSASVLSIVLKVYILLFLKILFFSLPDFFKMTALFVYLTAIYNKLLLSTKDTVSLALRTFSLN